MMCRKVKRSSVMWIRQGILVAAAAALLCWKHHNAYVVKALSNDRPSSKLLLTRRDAAVVLGTSSSLIVPSTVLGEKPIQAVAKTHEEFASVYDATTTTTILPLRFLPNGGCWAVRVILESEDGNTFSYYAVVDTGSPFLTCPPIPKAMNLTTTSVMPANEWNDPSSSQEQYGESMGEIRWRRSSQVTLGPPIIPKSATYSSEETVTSDLGSGKDVVLGVPTQEMIQDTGGIFVGLINKDDYRPTVFDQMSGSSAGDQNNNNITAFEILFDDNLLKLHSYKPKSRRAPYLIPPTSVEALQLFDLTPYGPDLYHYGVLLSGTLDLKWVTSSRSTKQQQYSTVLIESIPIDKLKRPVVAILDTGLTGCIFSDTLYNELGMADKKLTLEGLTVSMEPSITHTKNKNVPNPKVIQLTSNDQYWKFSSFHLPWFYDNDGNRPHIIALGCTFWTTVESLTIDTISKQARIKL